MNDFDPSKHLDNDEAIQQYLSDAFETGDRAFIADSIGAAIKAKGVSKISEQTGLSRTALYRTFSENGNPKLDTLLSVLSALNVSFRAESLSHKA